MFMGGISLGRVMLSLGLLLVPILIYLGLRYLEPGSVLLALLLLLAFRFKVRLLAIAGSSARGRWLLPILLLLSAAALWQLNHPLTLLIYPVAVNLVMFGMFGYSLLHPPSAIERLARLSHPSLPDEAIHYTRRVTAVWTIFFLLNGAVALWTAFQSHELWLLYNGLASYLLMGLLFGAEWMVRQRVMARVA